MDSQVCTPKEHTPVSATHPIHSLHNSTPQHSLHTPVKSVAGQHFNSQQYRTPTTRFAARYQHQYASSGGSAGMAGSPCLHTPSSIPGSAGSGRLLPGSGHRHMARYCTPQSASGKKLLLTPKQFTPQGSCGRDGVYNPFEHSGADALQGSFFSPNVFVQPGSSSIEHTPKEFCWTVDELALLKPADIDENAFEAQAHRYNPEMEEKAQRAIDKYFSNSVIVPSPWTESAKKRPFYLPRTPGAHAADSPMVLQAKPPACPSDSLILVKDASCQTNLSLPSDFDLQKVLGEHYQDAPNVSDPATHSSNSSQEDQGNGDVLSTSSLRRKLVFNGDNGSPLSPVIANEHGSNRNSRESPSPSMSSSPDRSVGSMHFSSSPIRGHIDGEASAVHMMTPALRRCSTAPVLMDSPELSPISSSKHKQLPSEDFLRTHGMTPHQLRLQGTPSPASSASSHKHVLSFPMSPGMSPIMLDKHDRRQGSHGLDSSWDIGEDSSPQRMPLIPSSLDLSDIKGELPHQTPHLESSLQEMETGDIQPLSHDINERDSPIVFYTRDDAEFQDEYSEQGLHTHDTGYHTNSLQSTTNQDFAGLPSNNMTNFTSLDGMEATGYGSAGLLHTDLTVQFDSLPISNHDKDFDSESMHSDDKHNPKISSGQPISFASSHQPVKTAIPRKVTKLTTPKTSALSFSNILSSDKREMSYDEDEILRKAHQALGKSSFSMDSEFISSSTESSGISKKLPQHSSTMSLPWQQSSNLGKQLSSSSALLQEKIVGDKTIPAKLLPSEVASYALKKAEKDFAKYCSKTTDIGAETFYFSAGDQTKPNIFSELDDSKSN